MYRYIKHKDIDFELWDECIDNAENGIIYALSWYLNIAAPGWDGIIKHDNGKYEAVMPVPIYRKFGIKYIKQPILCQQLGLFSSNKIDNKDFDEIGRVLKQEFKYIQRYEFNTGNTQILSRNILGIKQQLFTTYHLNLNQPYEDIFSEYKTDRRWRINKARRSEIFIRESEDIDKLIEIFHEHVAPKIYGIIGEEYEYKVLKALYYETKKRGMNTLLSAVNAKGETLAMGLFFHYNNKIIYIFNASTLQGKSKSAISLVVDKMLRDNSNKPLCFDFESPEIPQVAEFYRRFGSEATPFTSISFNQLPLAIKLIKRLRLKLYRTFIDSPDELQR